MVVSGFETFTVRFLCPSFCPTGPSLFSFVLHRLSWGPSSDPVTEPMCLAIEGRPGVKRVHTLFPRCQYGGTYVD